jgi:hypothetical protein
MYRLERNLLALLLIVLLTTACSQRKPAEESPQPSEMAVNPSSGGGATGRFSFRFSNRGEASARWVQFLFGNQDPSASPFCLVHYDLKEDAFKLYRGPGPGDFFGPNVPGTVTAPLNNGFCQVDTAASSTTPTGNGLSITVVVNFDASFAGERTIYARILDESEHDTGWRRVGVWTVPAASQ